MRSLRRESSNKTSVREMSRDVYLPKPRSEFFVVILFHDIWLVLNVKRLCVIVDRVINAANVYVNFV